ncbi:MAG: A/G-specific adenine glycosylase [Clostridia bacterium]|nr:A/G-specific adenine glycosylase [Clostridia bacterium]
MFQQDLLNWYFNHQRKLPWRENHDPYRIWLSEIMLQQTQVKTVIEYFNRFIEKYPTVQDMASAVEHDVLKLWEGLGYYSRARRLIPCAQMVVNTFEGEFPRDLKSMLKLPGVGHYTAGAILSIAYNEKIPAVDGNVMRVYSRFFNMDHDISDLKSRLAFENKVLETLPEDRRHYNQALMELGATVCTPKSPRCEICPIQRDCQALKLGVVNRRPVKTKKIKKKTEEMVVIKIICKDEFMIVKRPDDGLLAGMWGFPIYPIEGALEHTVFYWLKNDFNISAKNLSVVKEAKHVFTHLTWEMILVEVNISEKIEVILPEMTWIKAEALNDFPLPTAFKKLMD